MKPESKTSQPHLELLPNGRFRCPRCQDMGDAAWAVEHLRRCAADQVGEPG